MPIRKDMVEPDLESRLTADGVPVISPEIAEEQEIYPLTIGIANMMPNVAMQVTELQWSRWMGSEPVQQTGIKLIKFDDDCREGLNPETGELRSRTENLKRYQPLSEIDQNNLHCLVITGDNLEVEPPDGMSNREPIGWDEITYKDRLVNLIKWGEENVPVTILSCLAGHFGLNLLHGINKQTKEKKIFGIFEHNVTDRNDPITKGMGDVIIAPHARYGHVSAEQIKARNWEINNPERELKILALSKEAGPLIIKEALANGHIRLYLQGHIEYDRMDLDTEYRRDKDQGQAMPVDYYPDNNSELRPRFLWEPYARVLQHNVLGEMYRITETRRRRQLDLHE